MGLGISLNITDAFFASRISDDAAAAIGALLPVLLIGVSVFVSLGQAGCSVAGQLLGADRPDRAQETFSVLIVLHLVVGLAFSAALWGLRQEIPIWLGLRADIAAHATNYLAWIGAAQFVRSVQFAYVNILNAQGETRWTLVEGVLMNAVNVGLNALFLSGSFGFDTAEQRLQGVAWATVFATCFGLALSAAIVHLKLRLRFRFVSGSSVRSVRAVLRIGVPAALEPIAYHVSQIAIVTMVVHLGPGALAARTYVTNLMLLSVLWIGALGSSVQILVAHKIGAGEPDLADQELRRGMRWGAAGALGIALLLLLLRHEALGLFTSDASVIALAAPLFWIAALGETMRTTNIIAGGALRSSGDATYTALSGAAVMFGFSVPVCYVLAFPFKLGLIGIWLGMALDEGVRSLINWSRWRSGIWRTRGILQNE
ncbi:MAG: hypothetical protein RJA70_2463 [Pseudomonadota bacterium]|jgi:putative MATE family efflux protein